VLLLITGASGVGKSTVRVALAAELSPEVECVELADLTPLPAVMSRGWRQQTAEVAVRRAVELQASHQHLLLAGDPVPAIEIMAAPSAPGLDAVAVCLLDVSAEAQAVRLTARGDDPALLPHHQAFAAWMREQASDPLHMPHVVADQGWEGMRWERLDRLVDDWGMHTIDTSTLSKAEVAAAVREWCRRAVAGDAPTLRINSA
jgi:energy-coupling factor transporter ATP-binding protein EcfA2